VCVSRSSAQAGKEKVQLVGFERHPISWLTNHQWCAPLFPIVEGRCASSPRAQLGGGLIMGSVEKHPLPCLTNHF
jgi:hypothetical protein